MRRFPIARSTCGCAPLAERSGWARSPPTVCGIPRRRSCSTTWERTCEKSRNSFATRISALPCATPTSAMSRPGKRRRRLAGLWSETELPPGFGEQWNRGTEILYRAAERQNLVENVSSCLPRPGKRAPLHTYRSRRSKAQLSYFGTDLIARTEPAAHNLPEPRCILGACDFFVVFNALVPQSGR